MLFTPGRLQTSGGGRGGLQEICKSSRHWFEQVASVLPSSRMRHGHSIIRSSSSQVCFIGGAVLLQPCTRVCAAKRPTACHHDETRTNRGTGHCTHLQMSWQAKCSLCCLGQAVHLAAQAADLLSELQQHLLHPFPSNRPNWLCCLDVALEIRTVAAGLQGTCGSSHSIAAGRQALRGPHSLRPHHGNSIAVCETPADPGKHTPVCAVCASHRALLWCNRHRLLKGSQPAALCEPWSVQRCSASLLTCYGWVPPALLLLAFSAVVTVAGFGQHPINEVSAIPSPNRVIDDVLDQGIMHTKRRDLRQSPRDPLLHRLPCLLRESLVHVRELAKWDKSFACPVGHNMALTMPSSAACHEKVACTKQLSAAFVYTGKCPFSDAILRLSCRIILLLAALCRPGLPAFVNCDTDVAAHSNLESCGIHCLATSPDGGLLATGGDNPNDCQIWSVGDADCAWDTPPQLRPLTTLVGHKDWIFGVSWLTDRHVVTAGWTAQRLLLISQCTQTHGSGGVGGTHKARLSPESPKRGLACHGT
eukprot:jgi/Astpho2/6737/fgenesh1_pg.00102_%23_19_t